jgi:hypothetical protein
MRPKHCAITESRGTGRQSHNFHKPLIAMAYHCHSTMSFGLRGRAFRHPGAIGAGVLPFSPIVLISFEPRAVRQHINFDTARHARVIQMGTSK